jgi:hypothetical protein
VVIICTAIRNVNTLPSHVERRDCYPVQCWRITSYYVYLNDVRHMRLSAGLAHLSPQGYRQLGAGCLGLKLQTDRSWSPSYWNVRWQQRNHSFRWSVFLQLQSWLWVGMFCKRTIFCASYMCKHVLISLIIVTMKVWTVAVTSPQLVHITVVIFYWFTDPTIPTHIFPHTVDRNRFESIWQVYRFSENSQQTQDSEWLFKIWPVYEYFVQKVRSVYSPKQEL